MDIVRGAVFVGTLLLAWISLRPFDDLGDMQIGDVTYRQRDPDLCGVRRPRGADARAGDARQHAQGLATLLSPAFVLFGGWLCCHGRAVVRSEHVDPPLSP